MQPDTATLKTNYITLTKSYDFDLQTESSPFVTSSILGRKLLRKLGSAYRLKLRRDTATHSHLTVTYMLIFNEHGQGSNIHSDVCIHICRVLLYSY